MSKIIDRIKTKAEKLAELRVFINKTEESHRIEIEALKAKRDTIQNELLVDLRKEGLTSIKTANGESYARATRRGIDIINPVAALQWAKKNGAVAIDRQIVAAKLSKLPKIPAGFKLVETEFISVRKPKAENE